MTQRGVHFANDWISDAIDLLTEASDPRPFPPIDEWVAQLVADAALEGVSRREIEESVGDLRNYISDCLAESGQGMGEGHGKSGPLH